MYTPQTKSVCDFYLFMSGDYATNNQQALNIDCEKAVQLFSCSIVQGLVLNWSQLVG